MSIPSGTKPIVIFDGDCGFCKLWISRWKKLTGDRVEYAPYQEVSSLFPQIPEENFRKSVQFVEPDGSIYSGAEAVFRALASAGQKSLLLWFYQNVPGFSAVAERFYRLVADHRSMFLVLTKILWGKNLDPPTYSLSSWLFLRLLALIYLIAFVSLGVQIEGLIGSNGILPVTSFLDFVHQRVGIQGYWLVPTICWLQSSDFFLKILCGSGAFLSVLLLIGIAPPLVLLFLWILYLSLCAVGRDFLAFQWDILLLEAGFLAIFLNPLQIRSRSPATSPPTAGIAFLFRWLLFRLVFSSGITKLLSHDPTWRNLTALNYHYETQPLPTWIGWYAHQLPPWFQKISVIVLFAVEVFVPFLIFFPRRLRTAGFYFLVIFQILILLTGNYCFFNILTIALCFLLIDDSSWPARLHMKFLKVSESTPVKRNRWPRWIIIPLGVCLFLFSLIQMSITLDLADHLPQSALRFDRVLEPFRTINRYGLFAVMTTSRTEIILEGSNDGTHWTAYEFKYKPGDLKREPSFVAPHQPRLDWQMWFAALGTYEDNPWFIPFCRKLLEGSPEVLALMAKNPFPSKPPHYLRAMVYQYHFTDLKTKSKTGDWWKREIQGSYCPVMWLP
jgi:lipase maturation factor 1